MFCTTPRYIRTLPAMFLCIRCRCDITVRSKPPVRARSLIEASLDPLVPSALTEKSPTSTEAQAKVTGMSRRSSSAPILPIILPTKQSPRGYQQVPSRGFVTDYALTFAIMMGKLTMCCIRHGIQRRGGKCLGVFPPPVILPLRNSVTIR